MNLPVMKLDGDGLHIDGNVLIEGANPVLFAGTVQPSQQVVVGLEPNGDPIDLDGTYPRFVSE